MANPNAPVDGGNRRIPFLVDPENPANAYLQAGEGGIDMGVGQTDGAAAFTLPPPSDTATRSSVTGDYAEANINRKTGSSTLTLSVDYGVGVDSGFSADTDIRGVAVLGDFI